MPTYQYACTACDHQLEAAQSFSDDPLTVCPECEGRLRKVFSAVGVVFKGSGFYRTDSRAGNGSNGNNGSNDSNGAKSNGSDSAAKSEKSSTTKSESSNSSSSNGSSSKGSSSSTSASKAAAAS